MKKPFFLLCVITIISLFHYQLLAQQPEEKTASTQKQGTPKKNAFGIDYGVGSMSFKGINVALDDHNIFIYEVPKPYQYPVFALGVRYMHHFNPYIGADFFKFNFNCPFTAIRDKYLMNFQFMTGIRGNTPTFFKTMSGFCAARFGYGLQLTSFRRGHGFAFETEVGLNITPSFFVAFSYNLLHRYVDLWYGYVSGPQWNDVYLGTTAVNFNTCSLRIGVNL